MDHAGYFVSLMLCLFMTREIDCHNEDFLFMLAQEWPPSNCKKIQTEGKECYVPKIAKPWLIHGLWMDNGPGQHHQTENCKISQLYNRLCMKKIKDEMEMYWPSIVKHSESEKFWMHEWQTHGRCCTKCLKLSNQTMYFTEALNLRRNYDLRSMLRDKGIIPKTTKPYKISDIQSVILDQFGKKASLRCEYINKSAYLLRIFLCFNGSLEPVDCPSKISVPGETEGSNALCPESVIYPTM